MMDSFHFAALLHEVLGVGLPLLPALIGSRVGVLVSVLVGICARCRVEAGAHALAVSAPFHPVVHGNGLLQPLAEVLWSPVPAEDIREENSIVEVISSDFAIAGVSLGLRFFLI